MWCVFSSAVVVQVIKSKTSNEVAVKCAPLS